MNKIQNIIKNFLTVNKRDLKQTQIDALTGRYTLWLTTSTQEIFGLSLCVSIVVERAFVTVGHWEIFLPYSAICSVSDTHIHIQLR